MEYGTTTFVRDAARVVFDDEAPGITMDDDGAAEFDWDEVETVTIDNPPHADAFESKEFYRLPATVARPIRQPYRYSDEVVWLQKPREELKRAAWSLDNAPWTMGHPETGMVKNVEDIRGFWLNPRYIDSLDDLDSDLHIPTGDEEAKEFIEDNSDVSVGFYSKNVRAEDYDGVVGDADDFDGELDGYQVDMYFNHVASVARGRCPGEKGCGIDGANDHGHLDFISGTATTHKGSRSQTEMQSIADAPSGIKTDDGTWFAVGPGEHTKDSTDHPGDHMFPVDSCSDIEDAWNLRGSAEDLEISEDTLAERIIRAAEAKDCSGMPSTLEERMDGASDMQDCNCNENTTMTDFDIDFGDLSTEAVLAQVSEQHDGVDEYLDELQAHKEDAEAAREAAETLDLDSVESLAKKVGVLQDELDDLREFRDEREREAMEEHAEFIVERTDRFGEDADEVLEAHDDLDDIKDTRDIVEDLSATPTSEQTANAEADEGDTQGTPERRGKYRATPWDN